jgi:hypothetical protein
MYRVSVKEHWGETAVCPAFGSIAFNFSGMKKAGAGRANWGKPGDELFDYDDDIDYTSPSAE